MHEPDTELNNSWRPAALLRGFGTQDLIARTLRPCGICRPIYRGRKHRPKRPPRWLPNRVLLPIRQNGPKFSAKFVATSGRCYWKTDITIELHLTSVQIQTVILEKWYSNQSSSIFDPGKQSIDFANFSMVICIHNHIQLLQYSMLEFAFTLHRHRLISTYNDFRMFGYIRILKACIMLKPKDGYPNTGLNLREDW